MVYVLKSHCAEKSGKQVIASFAKFKFVEIMCIIIHFRGGKS